MLDVHPPHHSANTWRDFFIHIATIVVGLCIAVGIEQTVEYFHHRHQLAEARAALATERKININRYAITTEEFRRFVPILQGDLTIFVYLKQHPGKPLPPSYGSLRWSLMSIRMADTVWTAAEHNGVIDFMPQAEARNHGQLYVRLRGLSDALGDARDAVAECYRFAIVDPDPAHLSPEQLDRQIDLVSKALAGYRKLANVQANLHATFPDFSPSPSPAEQDAIVHVTLSDITKADREATAREIEKFKSYERSLDQTQTPE